MRLQLAGSSCSIVPIKHIVCANLIAIPKNHSLLESMKIDLGPLSDKACMFGVLDFCGLNKCRKNFVSITAQ